MGKSTNDLDEVASVEIFPGMKVMCTKLSLHALDLSYTQIVELALEIEKEFPSVQSYVTYPSSLYLTFSTYLDSDSILSIHNRVVDRCAKTRPLVLS